MKVAPCALLITLINAFLSFFVKLLSSSVCSNLLFISFALFSSNFIIGSCRPVLILSHLFSLLNNLLRYSLR